MGWLFVNFFLPNTPFPINILYVHFLIEINNEIFHVIMNYMKNSFKTLEHCTMND